MRTSLVLVCAGIAAAVARPVHAAPVTAVVTVRNQDGSPVEGGSVVMAGWDVPESQHGQFTFQYGDLAPGDHLLCYRSNTGIIALRTAHLPEGQAQVALAVRLGEQVVLQGKVVAGDPAAAMPYAQVKLTGGRSGSSSFPTEVVASAEGAFTLDGEAFAGARMQANLPYHKPSEWVEVKPPYPMRVELRCPPAAVVFGYVLDEGGYAISDAGVVYVTTGYAGNQTTDREGRFELRDLAAGRYRFTAGGPYRVPAGVTVDLRDGQQLLGLIIRLQRAPQFTFFGRAVAPDGVTGIEGAHVVFTEHLMPQGLDGRPVGTWSGFLHTFKYTGVSGERGYFNVNLPWREDDLSGHVWYPEITADGYLVGRFAVRVDRGPEWILFPMFRGGRLRADLPGLPDGAQVELEVRSRSLPPFSPSPSINTYLATRDAATGRFDFGLVQPGEHWLVVRQHGDILAKTRVGVKEGEETTVTLAVPSAPPP